MRILQPSKFKNLQGAIDLTPHCESSILKIDDKTFAFCTENAPTPFLVIESQIFGLLMLRIGERIIHYNAFRPRCLCCDCDGELTIRLTEIDGFEYQINEYGNIEICTNLSQLHSRNHERN